MKKLTTLLFLIPVSILLLTSCHERGCTNRDAINYNNTADQDDGSCIVCQNTTTFVDTVSVYLKDYRNSSSIYYNQNVAQFFLTQYSQIPNDKECGKVTNPVSLQIKNLINKDIFLYCFSVTRYNSSDPVLFFLTDNAGSGNCTTTIIPANSTIDKGIYPTAINNNPNSLSIRLDSLYIEYNTLSYQ